MNLTQRNIAIAVSLLIAGAILWYFREIVAYVLIAWVVSMLGQPLMRFFHNRVRIGKRRIPPSVVAVFVLTFFVLIIFSLVSIFVPLVVTQANNLSQIDYNAFANGLKQPIQELTDWGHRFGLIKPKEDIVVALQHSFSAWFSPTLVSDFFRNMLMTASSMAIGTVSVLFISFFFLKERNMFTEFVAQLVPRQYDSGIRDAVSDTTTMLSRYFSGLLLQMAFVAVFLTAALWIMGIQNALLIAIFAALINIVPYLGPMMGCAFALLITISSSLHLDFYEQTVPMLIKVTVLFGSMQFLNDWIIQPAIFSNRVAAHPLEIFIITLVGAKIGGIGGMILAIPTYTVIRIVAREFFNHIRIVRKITSTLDEVVPNND
ncbi:MAG: AI-2E family transporter [Saprospiraceae bacterium]|nr:AI-2E family transporter [Saprospiraceae bacterium]